MAPDDEPRAVVDLVVGDRTVRLHHVDDGTRCHLDLADDLLRLRLDAKRAGFGIRITQVRHDLRELFDLLGLLDQLDH